jgi:hypothetical protein
MDNNAETDGTPGSIYHIYHSQEIWFSPQKNNGHLESAKENLRRSEAVLKECTTQVDALEETLANTPKPSEALNWDTLTLQDLA